LECVGKTGCGLCYVSNTNDKKCSSELECVNLGTYKKTCDATPTPTPSPVPPPPPSECNAMTTCQTCAAKEGCGWCESQTKKCLKLSTTNSLDYNSGVYCKSLGGLWYERSCTTVVTPAPSPSPSPSPNEPTPTPKVEPTYNTATVKGTVSSTVDKTASDKVAAVIKDTIATTLKVDQSKVLVDVTTTLNSDGTTTFSMNIKVDASTVSNDDFIKGLNSISSDTIENSIQGQGVTVQSGSVSISSNNQNSYASRIVFVSLLLIAAVLLF